MGRKGTYCFIIAIIIVLCSYTTILAADALCRLMHNDHDALIIGEITEISEDKITIDIEKQIISSKDLNLYAPRKQIPMEGRVTVGEIQEYTLFYGSDSTEGYPQKGDYVLMSLLKKGDNFISAWGIFKLDSKEYTTLSVLYREHASKYIKMEAAAIKAFINSDGEKNEFSFDGSTGKVYSNDELIYEGALENQQISDEEDKSVAIYIDENKEEVKRENRTGMNQKIVIFTMLVAMPIGIGVSLYLAKIKKK